MFTKLMRAKRRKKDMKSERFSRQIYMMIAVMLIFFIGTGAIEFVYAPFLNQFTTSFVIISWLLAISFLMAFIVNIPIGNLADRIGAKFIISASLIILVFVGFFYTVLIDLIFLIPVLLLWGALYQGVLVPGEAYIRKKSKGKLAARALGFMEAAIALGFATGPIVASHFINTVGLHFTFYFYSIACLIAFVVVLSIKRVHKPLKRSYSLIVQADKQLFLKTIKRFAQIEYSSHHAAMAVLFVGFLVATWDAIIWFTIPFYYILGVLDAFWAAVMESVIMISFVVMLPISGIVAERAGRRNTIMAGFLLAMVFSFLFVLFIPNKFLMTLYAVFIAFGVALAFPAAESILTDLGYKKEMGKISGIYNMSKDLGYVVGTALTGSFVSMWLGAPFFFTGFMFAAAVGITSALILQ